MNAMIADAATGAGGAKASRRALVLGAGVAGLTFGSLWSLGYARRSASPLVLGTALLAGLAAALMAA